MDEYIFVKHNFVNLSSVIYKTIHLVFFGANYKHKISNSNKLLYVLLFGIVKMQNNISFELIPMKRLPK
jgi:hypothetical protein